VCPSAGHKINFDLAFPSDAIPVDFFPSDEATYGYTVSPLSLAFYLNLRKLI
jgi:hypothetical protein